MAPQPGPGRLRHLDAGAREVRPQPLRRSGSRPGRAAVRAGDRASSRSARVDRLERGDRLGRQHEPVDLEPALGQHRRLRFAGQAVARALQAGEGAHLAHETARPCAGMAHRTQGRRSPRPRRPPWSPPGRRDRARRLRSASTAGRRAQPGRGRGPPRPQASNRAGSAASRRCRRCPAGRCAASGGRPRRGPRPTSGASDTSSRRPSPTAGTGGRPSPRARSATAGVVHAERGLGAGAEIDGSRAGAGSVAHRDRRSRRGPRG